MLCLIIRISLYNGLYIKSVFYRRTQTFGNSSESISLEDVSLNFNDACRSRFNGRQMQNVVPFSRARKLVGKKSVADNRKCREHSGERRVDGDVGGGGDGGGDGDDDDGGGGEGSVEKF